VIWNIFLEDLTNKLHFLKKSYLYKPAGLVKYHQIESTDEDCAKAVLKTN
jgi:hypothetical protein